MVLKSPYDLDDQIYEPLLHSSDLKILPEELPVYTPQPASQTPGPEGDLCCFHCGLNSRIPFPKSLWDIWLTVT